MPAILATNYPVLLATNYKVFPIWLVIGHFANILFMLFMVRSGLEILSAFPKFYLSDDCPPGKEWLRLTRRVYSAEAAHPWSSLDEEESWSPVIALPGRKNLGLGRHWHFMSLQFWVANGAAYIAMLFATGWWRTMVPTSWSIFPDSVRDVGYYLMFKIPPKIPGMPFDHVQMLSYFVVVFILAPFQVLSGAAMSPSIAGRFPWYTRLFGGRQRARSLHFLGMCAFVVFIVVHTAMVIINDLPNLWTVMVLGHVESAPYHGQTEALIIGFLGLFGVVVVSVVATWFSRRYPRRTQRLLGIMVNPFEGALSRVLASRQRYRWSDISPYFRVNGYPPPSDDYAELVAGDFADYRLEVGGLVERPMALSLDELRALGEESYIAKHNCIQGWSAIAQWGGVPLANLMAAVGVQPEARHVAFYAFDDKAVTEGEGRSGYFYGTIPMYLADKPQTILAMEMNGEPLPIEHGAPVRLRIESQLGFKMVKWIRAIEFVADVDAIGDGQGGWREDQQFYSNAAGI
jgi:DMSO/TMAO reductase YedYZ molybdopterin-dependent catalytic subunit/thiosulfate reductase cytochrome b subunit